MQKNEEGRGQLVQKIAREEGQRGQKSEEGRGQLVQKIVRKEAQRVQKSEEGRGAASAEKRGGKEGSDSIKRCAPLQLIPDAAPPRSSSAPL